MEAGQVWLGANVGPSFRLGSDLAIPDAMLMFNGTMEYVFAPQWSVIAGVALGVSGTVPLKGRFGGLYRFSGFELPVSPYVRAEASAGRLFDVLGADLTSVGGRIGAGADYFLTAKWIIGAMVAYELASTTGQRPVWYGTLDVLLTFAHVL
ncbi:MAG: hypothetical protein H7Z43_09280 [Clostridia bacterium]|nr:hypothetical protein [Deltaproteobacteria bacterium]